MKSIPVTVRRSLELLGLFLLGAVIIIGKIIIMPLLLSFFVSLMLLPVFRFFRKLKVPEVISILLPIFFLTIFAILIVWLFSSQLSYLFNDLSQIQQNVARHLDKLSKWINKVFGFSFTEQSLFINEQSRKLFGSIGTILTSIAGSASGILLFFGLLPVYIFLIILYRNIFLKFVLLCFKPEQHKNVEDVIRQTEKMVKSYLVGLLIQIIYLIVLIWLSLMLFGIKHSLLIGIIFAFLNLIPYLGALISNVIAVIITLASSANIVDVLIVLGVIALVQFLDNNILMPRIVGYKVKINAFASIVCIVIAGSMVGISGMFLALPVMAALKIIFDRSEQYKKWGILLGDERPAKSPMQFFSYKQRQKNKQ